MGAKHWIIFIAIVLVITAGMIYTSVQGRLNVDDITTEQTDGILNGEDRSGGIGDHVQGNKNAKVVVIEYGDFQCPGCKASAPLVDQIVAEYKDNITFVYRNFPLTQSHPNARAAAASAEAAGLQDKYWEMHSLLFREQENWGVAEISVRNDIFSGYAEQLGLDLAKFQEDTASQQVTKKINFDVAIAKKHEVISTPTFIVNGETINTQAGGSALEDAIKAALNKAGVKVEKAKATTKTE